MDKPKGGRGVSAPYETKQMRVPEPLEPQIQELVSRYRDWISKSGRESGIGTGNPPCLLDKPVDNFSEVAQLDALREENTRLRSQLVETKEKLETAQAEASDFLDSAERWQMVAGHVQDQLAEVLKSPAAGLETARDQFLAGLRRGKQSPEYKAAARILSRFIAQLQK